MTAILVGSSSIQICYTSHLDNGIQAMIIYSKEVIL